MTGKEVILAVLGLTAMVACIACTAAAVTFLCLAGKWSDGGFAAVGAASAVLAFLTGAIAREIAQDDL